MPKHKGVTIGDEFLPEETARRRDEVIRRMANTPPQPRTKSSGHPTGKKKSSDPDRAGRKSSAGKGA